MDEYEHRHWANESYSVVWAADRMTMLGIATPVSGDYLAEVTRSSRA